MSIILKTLVYGVKALANGLKDSTCYKPSIKYDIDRAIELYSEGQINEALDRMCFLAHHIDCKGFHNYNSFHLRNVDARLQYNRLCFFIARIYKEKDCYALVKEWAENLAFLTTYDLSSWEDLLTPEDYSCLCSDFLNCQIKNDSYSGLSDETTYR